MSYANKSHYKVRDIILNKYESKCAYCGFDINKDNFHIDHIIPKQRGVHGLDCIDNFNPACAPCNISKSSFSIETWRKELELKIVRIERDSSTFRNLKRFDLVSIKKTKVTFYFETIK